MKLHIPNSLFAILLGGTLCLASVRADDTFPTIGYYTDGGSASTVTYSGDLNINEGDQVGASDDSGNLITSFKYAAGTGYTDNLKVSGAVTINGSGQLYLGGMYGTSYSKLTADSVTVNGDLTGGLANLNLYTDSADIGTFTMNSGTVWMHTQIYSGNSYVSGAKQVMIDNLNMNGGTLLLGSANTKYLNTSHYYTVLGSGSSSDKVTQTGGYLKVDGFALLQGGLTIDQQGGTMVFDDTAAVYGYWGSKTLTINQSSDDETTSMSLGKLASSSSAVTVQLGITQSGKGTITLKDGVSFSRNASITQTGDGTINLAGDFTSATFSVDQGTGTGLIELKDAASLKAGSLVLNTDATMNIAGALTLTDDAAITLNVNAKDSAALHLKSTGSLTMGTATLMIALSDDMTTAMTSEILTALSVAETESYTYTIDLMDEIAGMDVLSGQMENFTLDWDVVLDTTEQLTYTTGIQMAEDGSTMQAYVTATKVVPEPSTATLSLLALAGLVARRRRK